MSAETDLTLSLISHTNVGKTTLARTLLRRDVGETSDQAHVTVVSEAHTLIEAADSRLLLWDTPGFGDTARLLRRLKEADKPLGWFLSSVWDRVADRPLWCSQQAIRNVREDADVVLYLVNASEDPEAAPYVDLEMQILGWLGKPVIVLLNQTGAAPRPDVLAAEEARWEEALSGHVVVQEVRALDAFARCWVQENELISILGRYVPPEKKAIHQALAEAWEVRNLEVFRKSIHALAEQLASSALDGRDLPEESIAQKIGLNREALKRAAEAGRAELGEGLAKRVTTATGKLIALHQLEGEAAAAVADLATENFGMPERVDEPVWGALGGAATGAAGGLVADVLAGGMTFLGGAVAGGIGGGVVGYLLAAGYNLAKGGRGQMRWSAAHFREQVSRAILSYLAVAHFGRGRGEWRAGAAPEFWVDEVRGVVDFHGAKIDAIWDRAGKAKADHEKTIERLDDVLVEAAADALQRLYPEAEVVVRPS